MKTSHGWQKICLCKRTNNEVCSVALLKQWNICVGLINSALSNTAWLVTQCMAITVPLCVLLILLFS